MLVVATFGIPILGSLLALLADRISAFLRNAVAVLILLVTLGCVIALIPMASEGHVVYLGVSSVPGYMFSFVIDGLAIFVAAMSAVIGLMIVTYSIGYMRGYANLGEYYFLVVLFLGAMMGLVLSDNLLLIYTFWEITAICSWRLIGFYRDPEHLQNADTALMMTVTGSFFMLIGIEMVWREVGSLSVSVIHGHPISDLAMFFIFVGILAKSAQVPLQIWLPSAGVAPSPVTALLHAAVLVVIGVFAFARIFIGAFNLPVNWQNITFIVAVTTILVASGAAYVEYNAKRILAYSTLGQLAYVYLGFATMTTLGIVGALLYLLAHSFAKAGMFLCIGIIERQTHTKDIRELSGFAHSMRATALAFLLCALTIIGFPPSAGFIGKLMIIFGALESGNFVFAGLAVLGAVLTIAYTLRLYNSVFLGALPARWKDVKEGTPGMVLVVMVFAILSLLTGLFVSPLLGAVNLLVAQIMR
jgi:NADH:ubiquinone oxidoreductase subunit 5 (subunit L)/multisubunit Na+/H+ antiporter MnhA subunit